MSTERGLPNFRLDSKVVLITGASSGLGQQAALTMARAGAHVVITARSRSRLDQAVQEIATAGGKVTPVELDVTDANSVRQCLDRIEAEVGVPHVLVNNAGVSLSKPLLDQSEDDWDLVMDTNLKGAWLVATETARRMKRKAQPGSIVNISSILGERVAGGVAPYAISKAGLIQATKVMALELARFGIRVNALLPGYVATDLNRDFLQSEAGQKLQSRIPTRRFGELSDLDGPLLLLASDAGRGLSGACIAVDAGHLVSSL
jgi:NAD(P)-dependent dehydrogenase (short-subunit alcohol dehydrogenase family)